MKRLCMLLLLCLLLTQTVYAVSKQALMVDRADLLTSSEEAQMEERLQNLGETYGMDVVIVTTNTLEGKSPRDYADDYYDTHEYSYDGVLLLVSMEDNDWYISTSGYGITAFTDAGIDYIGEQITDELGDGQFLAAFEEFADLCDDFISQANTGKPYDYGNLPEEPFSWFGSLILALIVGLVTALIVVHCLKRQLKSVRRENAAASYVRAGSLQLTGSGDIFLYRTLSRRERPRESSGSSTHRSSSGRSHGGRGGKF